MTEPRYIYRDFGCWDSRMLTVEDEDGEPVILLNARYTREQLMERLPHEFAHILLGHLHDPRPVSELEAEADKEKAVVMIDTQ